MLTATLPLASPTEVLRLIGASRVLGLDLETTGLDPSQDRIRLLSLSDGNRGSAVVLDLWEHPSALPSILEALRGKVLVAHHAAFDLGFLWEAGLTDPPETICTYLLAQLLTAGEGGHGFGHCGLAACALRWLGKQMPKELQTSDWSGPLSPDQVEYSRRDAQVLPYLLQRMNQEIENAGLQKAADIEMRALRSFVWMARAGVPFDRPAWEELAAAAATRKAALGAQLDAQTKPKGQAGVFGHLEAWNWDSPKQVKEMLALGGIDVDTTNDAQLALIGGVVPELIRQHRHQATLLKMYGANWLESATILNDRVYPHWRQLGAASGRTSCETPNMQQVPRDDGYRACVRASEGKVLIKADYATLQMRIACNLAKDFELYKVFAEGGDPHTATAKALLCKNDVTKADRQVAKSANFGLLFGMSPEGLRVYAKKTYGVNFTEEEAKRHHSRFFQHYSGLARWHNEARRLRGPETRSIRGRRRLLPHYAPDTWRLNSPVQADESDGLKTALAFLWEQRAECPGAVPVLTAHDEIVVEAPIDQAEQAKEWLAEAMVAGMAPILDPVPTVVEAQILPTWGG